jgi:hypothetical protein
MIKSAKVTWKTAIIPITTVFLIWWCKISPAYVILAAIAGSLIYALIIQRCETKGQETEDRGRKTEDGGRKAEGEKRRTVISPKSPVPRQERKEVKP